MSLQKTIEADLIAAMKSRDADRLAVLRTLKSAVKNKAIDQTGELTDADVIAVIKSEVKKRKDAVETFRGAGREDLAAHDEAEIAVLQAYMPAMMSADAVREKVSALIASMPEADRVFGKVMGAAVKALAGQADSGEVNKIVKELLNPEQK